LAQLQTKSLIYFLHDTRKRARGAGKQCAGAALIKGGGTFGEWSFTNEPEVIFRFRV